jgi:hypothetical protein
MHRLGTVDATCKLDPHKLIGFASQIDKAHLFNVMWCSTGEGRKARRKCRM